MKPAELVIASAAGMHVWAAAACCLIPEAKRKQLLAEQIGRWPTEDEAAAWLDALRARARQGARE